MKAMGGKPLFSDIVSNEDIVDYILSPVSTYDCPRDKTAFVFKKIVTHYAFIFFFFF